MNKERESWTEINLLDKNGHYKESVKNNKESVKNIVMYAHLTGIASVLMGGCYFALQAGIIDVQRDIACKPVIEEVYNSNETNNLNLEMAGLVLHNPVAEYIRPHQN